MANLKKLKRLTLDQIIAAKEQKEKDRLAVKEIEIPSMGGTLLFRRPTDEQIFDFVDNIKDDDSTQNTCDNYASIIHACCEELRDPKLYEEIETDHPVDIVYKVMDANDIITVGDAVCSLNPLYGNAGETVKNG